ncbi:MAG TPA: DUF1592 domain-containing protein, partial [Pirellulales bacterium]|nr:DUF1592 domain-containing protein [Pirellulales bacterium]
GGGSGFAASGMGTGGSAATSGAGTGPGSGTVTATGPNSPVQTSRAMRLSNAQWENTIQDLFRLAAPLGLSAAFVTDPSIGAFDTYGATFVVDANRFTDYQTAAEAAAKTVAHNPQIVASLAPPAADATTRKTNFIRSFGQRAFRRPLSDADVARYSALFDQGATLIGSGDAFVDGVELSLRAFLQSPNFLYRLETSTNATNGRVPLSDYEIAARLSYGLTESMPDDNLSAAAAAGQLHDPTSLGTQAQRLVASARGQAAVLSFHGQLLNVSTYDQISKDPTAAPAFTPDVVAGLKQETFAFVNDVVFGQDRGIAELLSAPYTFANSKIAKIYGVTVPAPAAGAPDPFVKLSLNPAQRAGFMTQVGFLAANAVEQTPGIIPRGVLIAKNLLCVAIPPPPANRPDLPALDPMSTNRQRVTTLTMNAPCSTCHTTMINPLGFGLETLDGYGQYRTTENGHAIDATGTYTIDGQQVMFNGPVELMKAIANSEQARECYALHLAEYIYGRDVDLTNAAEQSLVAGAGAFTKSTPSTKGLVAGLVATDIFINRAP